MLFSGLFKSIYKRNAKYISRRSAATLLTGRVFDSFLLISFAYRTIIEDRQLC